MNQFNRIPISEIMTRDVVTVPDDGKVIDRVEVFREKRINHAPVKDARGEVIGMLSLTDVNSYFNLVQIINTEDTPVLVKDIMSEPIFAYFESVTVQAAAEAMLDNHIHAIVVMNEAEKMTGILTSTDLIAYLAEKRQPGAGG